MRYGAKRTCSRALISAVTTQTEIIAAPGATYRILILGMVIGVQSNATVTLRSGSTIIGPTYGLAANIPMLLQPTGLAWQWCAENENFSVTSSQSANGWVLYQIARV